MPVLHVLWQCKEEALLALIWGEQMEGTWFNGMCCFFCTQGPSQPCFSSTGYLEKAATGWKIWLTTALASY